MNKIIKAVTESVMPKHQCCFCGKPIEAGKIVLMTLDLGDNQFQSLSTHGLCLQERLHSSVPFVAPELDK